MAKLKEKKRLLLALSCIVVLVVIFSAAFYTLTVKKDIPQGLTDAWFTIHVYEANTTRNLIIWRVVDCEVWEGKSWADFNARILVNGTFYANATLPPGTVNNDDLIVAYVPVRGLIELLIIQCGEPGNTVGVSWTVEFY